MNTLALQNKQNFPLTTDALSFMQDAYSALEQLGKLGGDNYILTGCTVTGSSVSSGWMVIGGKLVPFAGGSIQTNVRLVTTADTITVGTGTRDETVITAEFGTSTNPAENVPWATLNANRPLGLVDVSNRVKALEPLNAAVQIIDIVPEAGQLELYTPLGGVCRVAIQGWRVDLTFCLRALSVTTLMFTLPSNIPWPVALQDKPIHGVAYTKLSESPYTSSAARFTINTGTRHCIISPQTEVGMVIVGNISWSI